jgi:hypothetical protein
MSTANLGEKFPDMRPLDRPPSLTCEYRVGTTLVGRRDFDPETNTWVATRFFCLGVPLVALGAYRVSAAPSGGFYFHGRVSLSAAARLWTYGGLMTLLVGWIVLGWWLYTSSATYRAGQMLDEADRLAVEGRAHRAAELYAPVLASDTRYAAKAHQKLMQLIEAPPQSLEETAGVFAVAVRLKLQELLVAPDLYQQALVVVKQNEERDPRGALIVFEAVAPLVPSQAEQTKVRRRLLDRAVAKEPKDPELASGWAVVCYQQGELPRCFDKLHQLKCKLGRLDGAALLGQLYAAQGRYQEAEEVLSRFLEERWKAYQLTLQTIKDMRRNVLAQIAQKLATDFPYEQYQAAKPAEKLALEEQYVAARLVADRDGAAALQKLKHEWAITAAVLDLAIVRVHLAHQTNDPEQRRKKLAEAEQGFLLLHGEPTLTDTDQLKLAELHYQLGRPAEGKKIFDALLKKSRRSFEGLLVVAEVLSVVGSTSEARPLLEEAYNGAKEPANKQLAALKRATLSTGLDDNIAWLERAEQQNVKNVNVKASLAVARAATAVLAGKEKEAIRSYREALADQDALPTSAGTLNAAAQIHFALYHLTHEGAELQQGMDKLNKAVLLQPSTALLAGAAALLINAAVEEVIGSKIDLKLLKQPARLEMLWTLCNDQKSKDVLAEQLRTSFAYRTALGYYRRLLVLSPHQAGVYRQWADLEYFTGNRKGLDEIWTRLQKVSVDHEQADQAARDEYAGKNEEQIRNALKAQLALRRPLLDKVTGNTRAVAVVQFAGMSMRGARMGLAVDARDLVDKVEKVCSESPSTAMRTLLIQALIFKAHQALIAQDPEYKVLADKTQRSLGPALLTVVLNRGGKLADKVRLNKDVERALNLQGKSKELAEQEPMAWGFLRQIDPRAAEDIAKSIRADKQGLVQTRHRIDLALSPLVTNVILDDYWLKIMEGRPDQAEAVLRAAAEKKVPMPVDETKK